MDITYLGHSSFEVRGDVTVVIDPPSPRPADLTLYTKRQKDRRCLVNGPGEYEIGGILIVTAAAARSSNLTHAIGLAGLNLVHLGVQIEPLHERDLEAIGKVDILLLSADDLPAAQKAVGILEPRVVLPFGTGASPLCAALGEREIQERARFSWNGVSPVPRAVLLKPSPATRRVA